MKEKQLFSFRYILLLIILPIFVVLGSTLPFVISGLLGFSLAEKIGLDSNTLYVLVIIDFLISYLAILILIYQKIKRHQKPWSIVGINSFPVGKSILYILGYFAIAFGLLIAVAVIAAAFGLGTSDTTQQQPNNVSAGVKQLLLFGGFWKSFIPTVILAPIVEEILYRGIIFKRLEARYGVIIGVLLSSVIFAIVHINPIQVIGIFPLGIYLCFMYKKLGSIVPGIILHALWNLFAGLVAVAVLSY